MNKIKAAFEMQRYRAAYRGIDFLFTFEEWLEWWGDDIDKRGSGKNGLCMARNGDIGPYASWNVRKATISENSVEAMLGRKMSDETKRKMSIASSSRTMSPEARAKIGEAHTGKTVSEEAKQKLREANIGKTHSEETKRKMSEKQKSRPRKPMSEEHKQNLREAFTGKKKPQRKTNDSNSN